MDLTGHSPLIAHAAFARDALEGSRFAAVGSPSGLRPEAFARDALELLVLYGSRARGVSHTGSDWDIGYLGAAVDPDALRIDLVAALGSEAVDLVDLGRAGALLRFHVARDGVPLYESRPERFIDFQLEATRCWLDMEPVVRAANRAVLAALGP